MVRLRLPALVLLATTLLLIGCDSRAIIEDAAVVVRSPPERQRAEGSDAGDKVATNAQPRHFNRVIVLLVAINEYQSPDVGALELPLDDAKNLKELFETNYGYEVEVLANEMATKAAIENAIFRLDNELGADDALIVHFGGHGMSVEQDLPEIGSKGYYVPYDATVSSLETPKGKAWKASVIEMSAFSDRLATLSIGHVLLLADCCKSGFAAQRRIRGGIDGRRDLEFSVLNPSCSIVTATTSTRRVSGGHFSNAFRVALKKREPKSLCEVVVDVKRTVAERGLRPQHVQLRNDGGDFVFIPLAVSVDEVDVLIQNEESKLQERRAKLTTLTEALFAFNALDYRLGNDPFRRHEQWKKLFEKFDEKAMVQHPVDGLAQFSVYQCCIKGLGVGEADPLKAFNAAVTAYQSGDAIGKFLVGDAFYRGVHVEQNKIAGLRLVEEAAKDGSPIAKFVLGDILLTEGGDGSLARGVELLEDAAKAGIINADIALAQAYSGVFSKYKATKIPRNIDKAIQATIKVIDNDVRPAEGSYQGFLMQETFGGHFKNAIPKDRLFLLLDASHRGFPDAQVDLAKVYLFRWEDYGFHQDEGAARDLILAAAKANNRVAHDMLSFFHSQGELFDLDYELAREHGIKASNLGSGQASRRMGVWHYDGNVVEQDYAKAFQFFRKAASQNDAEGCKCLASMFDRGEGPAASLTKPEQLSEATHWLMKSCELGDANARDYFVSEVTNKFSHISWRGAERQLCKTYPDSALTMIRRAAYRARYLSGREKRVLPTKGAATNWSQIKPKNPDAVHIGGFAVGENVKASFYAVQSFVSDYPAFLRAWFGRYSGEAKQKAIKQIEGGLEGTVSGTFHEPAWLDEKEHAHSGYKTIALALDGGLVCDLTGPSEEVDAARDVFISYAKSL